MPQGPDGNTIIIVKKVSGHGGHHGGAWKVAYADFVTSMMALFMVLWLVSSAPDTVRETIAEFFRHPGLFRFDTAASPIHMKDAGLLERKISNEPVDNMIENITQESDTAKLKEAQNRAFREIADKIENNIVLNADLQGGDILENISVTIDDQGLHIEIMDSKKASMFESGKDIMPIEAQRMIYKLAVIIKDMPNPIEIAGHTDSVKFNPKITHEYDNWYLSADRANAARRMFIQAGINPGRIVRIIGYADTQPRDKEDLSNPANRRITITLRYDDVVAKKLLEIEEERKRKEWGMDSAADR